MMHGIEIETEDGIHLYEMAVCWITTPFLPSYGLPMKA